jgi:hypothetical protein
MKHIFLFLIVFSISIFAQKNNPDFKLLNSTTSDLSILNKTTNSNKSTTFIQKIDSTLTWRDIIAPWGFLGHPFVRGINWTYDANNNLISQETQIYNSTLLMYEKYSKHIYTYDLFNNQTNHLRQTWNSTLSTWVNDKQYSYSFNLNNDLLTELYQIWSAGAWLNQELTTKTYDINHNNLTLLQQTWSAGAWLNLYHNLFNYDASNKCTSTLQKAWDTLPSTWKDLSRSTLIYDANNDCVYILAEKWTTAWSNDFNYTFTYDANHNQLSDIKQNWSGGWINNVKGLYVYDASNNRISDLFQSWISATSSWYRTQTYTYNYDINHFIKNVANKGYAYPTGINIVYEDSIVYYFHTVVVEIDELHSKQDFLTISPNPNNGTFKLITEAQISSIDVINSLGILVAKPEIINNEVNLSFLPSGIYFLKVYNNKQIGVTKVVIE